MPFTDSDFSVWQKRWETLEQVLEAMSKQYGDEASNVPSMETLHSLVECLKAFGKSQVDFFYDGFKSKKLLPSMDYPKEHVMRATVDQIAYDTAVFQAAAGQRMNDHFRIQLEKADHLAQLALDVAVNSKLLKEKCTVLTYFNKSPNIRVIPYAPVALIGIPLTCINTPRDYLAIPHEVGHYVYHHAPGLAADLHTLVPIDPPYADNWIEEIFADVFGCLIAGPVIGMSFQDLLFDDSLEEFVFDDGDHPVEAIRPFGYSKALNLFDFDKAAPKLTKRWKNMLKDRHSPTLFSPFRSCTEAPLKDAQTAVDQTTDMFASYLANKGVNQPEPWSKDTDNIDTLYNSFENWAASPPSTTVCILKDLGHDKVGLVCDKNGPTSIRRKGATNTWRDWFKVEIHKHQDLIPWFGWFPIYTSLHWPIKGPTNGTGGGD